MPGTITFEPMGIGDLLRRSRHVVPPNQRSYAWEARHVEELLQDINAEMSRSAPAIPEYFLGTIVLVEGKDGAPPNISDGQQRLATTSIILARIRDLLNEIGQSQRAAAIEQEYLAKIDFDTGDMRPQVSLNSEDHDFFLMLSSRSSRTPCRITYSCGLRIGGSWKPPNLRMIIFGKLWTASARAIRPHI